MSRTKVIHVRGMDVRTDKAVNEVRGDLVVFADGSWCNVTTREVSNKGGAIEFLDSTMPEPLQDAPRTRVGPLRKAWWTLIGLSSVGLAATLIAFTAGPTISPLMIIMPLGMMMMGAGALFTLKTKRENNTDTQDEDTICARRDLIARRFASDAAAPKGSASANTAELRPEAPFLPGLTPSVMSPMIPIVGSAMERAPRRGTTSSVRTYQRSFPAAAVNIDKFLGEVRVELGDQLSVEVDEAKTGDVHIAVTDGVLQISGGGVAGYGLSHALVTVHVPKHTPIAVRGTRRCTIGAVDGALFAELSGKEHLTAARVRTFSGAVSGSADIRIDEITGGDCNATIYGAGTIAVAAGTIQNLAADIAGGGEIDILATAAAAHLVLTRAGSINVDAVTNRLYKFSRGRGTITIGQRPARDAIGEPEPQPHVVTSPAKELARYLSLNPRPITTSVPAGASALQHSSGTSAPTAAEATLGSSTTWQDVVDLFDELEQAWLDYELDPQNYFLDRPLLRDNTVPTTAAYQEARYNAKEAIDNASSAPEHSYVIEVDKLVETAWETWRMAYDHAYSIGIDDRSPAEKKALRWAAGALKHLQRPDINPDERSHYLQVLQDNINVLKTVPVPAATMARIRAQITAANYTQIPAAANERKARGIDNPQPIHPGRG